jgi:transposase-like protein
MTTLNLTSINKIRKFEHPNSVCQESKEIKKVKFNKVEFIDYGKRYPKEFKLDVLRRILIDGETTINVINDIGVPKQTVYRWLTLQREGKLCI